MSMTNFQEDWLDEEGRVVMLQYDAFILFNVYFPNGGSREERLKYKLDFYDKFFDYIQQFRKKGKNIIICGDVNTAHHEIDLARPKQNEKTSGFMPIERAWLDKLVEHDYIDTFRQYHPDKAEEYTWWDMKTRARDRNVGWRIDYFWANKELLPQIKDAFIWQEVMGSDHAPVGIKIEM